MRSAAIVSLVTLTIFVNSARGDGGAARPQSYTERLVQWISSFFSQPPPQAQNPSQAQSAPSQAKAPAQASPEKARNAGDAPMQPFPPLMPASALARPAAQPGANQAPALEVEGREAARSLEALRLQARRLASSLPVVAPIAIQPALAQPRAITSAQLQPQSSMAAATAPLRVKRAVAAMPALPAAARGLIRRMRAPNDRKFAPGEPVDPATLHFTILSRPAPLARPDLMKVDPLEREQLALLEGLFSWLLYRNDEALVALHALGQATTNPELKRKAFSYEGWILEDSGQPGLAGLALWRALELAAEPARGDKEQPDAHGYVDPALRTLLGLSHLDSLAKAAPSDRLIDRLLQRAGLGPEARGFLALVGAERAYDKKDFAAARKLAQSVTAVTGWKEQARYLAADALVAGSEDPAAERTAGKELTELFRTVEDPAVFDATASMLGRIHFLLGNYKAAHQYLAQVSHETNLFIDAAVDNGWALLHSGDRNHAVGNMFTLHTPFFDGAYMPESYFLQTLGYQEICQFGDAFTTLRMFRARYDATYKKLSEFNAETPTAAAAVAEGDLRYYNDLVAYLSHANARLPEIVLRELGRRPEFLRRQRELNDLAHETVAVAKALPLSGAKVVAWLEGEITALRSARVAAIARFLRARALEMQDELKYLVANISLLEYEVYAGAGRNLSLQGAQNFTVDARKAVPKRQFEEGQEYWPYEDEIWEDELNNFRSKMVNACASVGKDADEDRAPAATGEKPAAGSGS